MSGLYHHQLLPSTAVSSLRHTHCHIVGIGNAMFPWKRWHGMTLHKAPERILLWTQLAIVCYFSTSGLLPSTSSFLWHLVGIGCARFPRNDGMTLCHSLWRQILFRGLEFENLEKPCLGCTIVLLLSTSSFLWHLVQIGNATFPWKQWQGMTLWQNSREDSALKTVGNSLLLFHV